MPEAVWTIRGLRGVNGRGQNIFQLHTITCHCQNCQFLGLILLFRYLFGKASPTIFRFQDEKDNSFPVLALMQKEFHF